MNAIAGIILAGGRASRMGGSDKALVELAGKPLVRRCIERLWPQVSALAISSNAKPDLFETCGLPVVADADDRRSGPLAGILAGLRWAHELVDPPCAIVSAAVDTPFFPGDLVSRLAAAGKSGAAIAMASSAGSVHPTFALWPLSVQDDLARFIEDGASLKVSAFAEAHGRVLVEFPEHRGVDPFFNINTPEDLRLAETIAGQAE